MRIEIEKNKDEQNLLLSLEIRGNLNISEENEKELMEAMERIAEHLTEEPDKEIRILTLV